MHRYLGALGLALLWVVSAFGQTRPNFSGTWKQTGLRDAVRIDKIEHQDPELRVTEDSHEVPYPTTLQRVSAGIMSDKREYRTDGSEQASGQTEDRGRWSSTYWNGSALVFQTVVKSGYHVTVTRATWSLSDDGKLLTKTRRVVNMDGVTEETATFEKQ